MASGGGRGKDTCRNALPDPLLILGYGKDKKTLFAWVLRNAKRLKEPVEIEIPRGAQVWVQITPEKEEEVWKRLEG